MITFLFILVNIYIKFSSGFYNKFYNSARITQLYNSKSSITVSQGVDKERIDNYLASLSPHVSRSAFGILCDSGKVFLNNKIVKKNKRVSSGDIIEYEIEPKIESSVQPENIDLDIIFEDENLIIVNKPAGMVVHPAPGSPNGTFVNALIYHLGDKASSLLLDNDSALPELDEEEDIIPDLPETPDAAKAAPRSLRPGIVHRLDKGTSGVLIAGKNTEAVAKLSALFSERKIRKLYLSVCIGHPGETTIVEPIGRSLKNRQVMAIFDGPPGKPAVTHIRTLSFDGKISTVLARIETGRTHQIRVHLKHRRTPILGDETYGNIDWNRKFSREMKKEPISNRPLLHAYEVEFIHPFTGKSMIINAPIPNDMLDAIKRTNINDEDFVKDGLLTCSTEVLGRKLGSEFKNKGYVPLDRLTIENTHWTDVKLLENPLDSHSTEIRLGQRGKW